MNTFTKLCVLMAAAITCTFALPPQITAEDPADIDRLLNGGVMTDCDRPDTGRPEADSDRGNRATDLLDGPIANSSSDEERDVAEDVVVVDGGEVTLGQFSRAHARPIECGFGFSLTDVKTFSVDNLHDQQRVTVGGVRVYFLYEGSTTWTKGETRVVVDVLRTISVWTSGNSLLLTNPKFGHRHINLVKTTSQRLNEVIGKKPPSGGTWAGVNMTRASDTYIVLPDWDETNARENRAFRSTLVHEIGHNFDTIHELSELTKTRAGSEWGAILGMGVYWKFVMLGGWLPDAADDLTPAHRRLFEENIGEHVATRDLVASRDGNWRRHRSASFARSYGETNPFEDWSATFELYYRIAEGEEGPLWRNKYRSMIHKLKVVDAFVACLHSQSRPRLFTLDELKMVLGNSDGVPW